MAGLTTIGESAGGLKGTLALCATSTPRQSRATARRLGRERTAGDTDEAAVARADGLEREGHDATDCVPVLRPVQGHDGDAILWLHAVEDTRVRPRRRHYQEVGRRRKGPIFPCRREGPAARIAGPSISSMPPGMIPPAMIAATQFPAA